VSRSPVFPNTGLLGYLNIGGGCLLTWNKRIKDLKKDKVKRIKDKVAFVVWGNLIHKG